MKRQFFLAVAALVLSASPFTLQAGSLALDPHLEPLRPMLEKTWRGFFKDSTPDKPKVDVARWERALNGRAVRVIHSVNDGIYGGETLIQWDEKKQSLVYHYFTTAAFNTAGTMTCKDGKFFTREVVVGDAGGINEVRSTGEFSADGTYRVKAEFLKDGAWVPGHEITYKPDPDARVIFK